MYHRLVVFSIGRDTPRAKLTAPYNYCISRHNFFGGKQLWVL